MIKGGQLDMGDENICCSKFDTCDYAKLTCNCVSDKGGLCNGDSRISVLPDSLTLLELWTQYEFRKLYQHDEYEEIIDFLKNLIYYQQDIINQLRKDPYVVLKELKEKGVWKE